MHARPAARLTPLAAAALLVLALAAPAAAAPRLTPIGAFTEPVYVTAPPQDPHRLFVVEKAGLVKVMVDGGAAKTFLDIRGEVDTDGEEGLLSMAFAPDYATSRRFYVYFTAVDPALEPGSRIKVVEFLRSQADPDLADATARRTVIEIPHPTNSNHDGGQLQFGPDRMLWLATGDGGAANDPPNNAQNTRSLLGKMLRLDPTPTATSSYTIPSDNPFANGVGGAPEVWAYGLRNPWRFSFDRATGELTIGDVGQGTREEIDFVPSTAGPAPNFGWRCFEGSVDTPGAPDCNPPDHVPPVFDYDSTSFGCTVIGGYVVRDPQLPTLAGRYLYADLCRPKLRSIALVRPTTSPDRDREEATLELASTVSFGEDSCGHVYVASLGGTVARVDDEPFQPCPEPPPDGGTGGGTAGPPGGADGQPPGGAAPPEAGPDTTAPRLAASRARRQRLLARRRVRLAASCSEACTLATEANVRLAIRGRTRRWAFADTSRLAAAGARELVTLRLTEAMRRALAARVRAGARPLVKVVLVAGDAAGNLARRTVYVRVVG